MLEVEQSTDVGRALDIVNDKKLTLAMSLGRHTNDMMTSFYVRTPSGFEIEYGPDRASAIGVVPLSSLKDLDISGKILWSLWDSFHTLNDLVQARLSGFAPKPAIE